MKKYDELWSNINCLLSSLYSNDVVDKVNQYYLVKFGNSAPGKNLQEIMDKLQEKLDKAGE